MNSANEMFQVFAPYMGTAECDDPRKQIVPIGAVYRQPENANTHPDRNMRGIRSSLCRRGQTQPLIVDRDGMIIVGNGRHEGMELEGWKFVWIVTTHLTGPELLAYGIADNQLTRTSEWDWEVLAGQIGDLKALDGTEFEMSNDDLGFEDFELSPMLAAEFTPAAARTQDDGNNPSGAPDSAAAAADTNAPAAEPNTPGEPQPHQVSTPPSDADDRARNDLAINGITPNMRLTIDQALERVRAVCSDNAMTEGKCIELICADYLSGH